MPCSDTLCWTSSSASWTAWPSSLMNVAGTRKGRSIGWAEPEPAAAGWCSARRAARVARISRIWSSRAWTWASWPSSSSVGRPAARSEVLCAASSRWRPASWSRSRPSTSARLPRSTISRPRFSSASRRRVSWSRPVLVSSVSISARRSALRSWSSSSSWPRTLAISLAGRTQTGSQATLCARTHTGW